MWDVLRLGLVTQLTQRELDARYRSSVLGGLWAFLVPILMLLVYTYVFGVVFKSRWDQSKTGSTAEFALILFAGLTAFNLFAEVVSRAPSLVSGQPNLVTTVAFPIRILAVVSLLVAFVQAGISTIILLCFQIVFAEGPHLTILLVPVVLLPLCLLVLGLAWLLSALGVFVPDAGQVVPPFIAAMMFLNPIFYPISQLPDWIRPFAEYSPLAFSIDAMRQVVVFGQPPRLGTWLVALAIGGFVALLGYTFFARTQKGFADVL